MIFTFPKHNFPSDIFKIYRSLKSKGILGDYGPRYTFPDEPQLFQYACERNPCSIKVKKGFGLGCSERESDAFTAAVAEAIEHYCILYERDELAIHDSYSNLTQDAVDPFQFLLFSQEQLRRREYAKFRFTEKTQLNWLEGYSLTKKKKVLVPASLVYADYDYVKKKEPLIQIKNSTGAACGSSMDSAIYRGICEIIERDAYMISFINSLHKQIISLDDDDNLLKLKRRVERYDLEAVVLNTQLDFPMTTTTCLILDKTGGGPAVSTGLGGSLDPKRAIQAAVYESVRCHVSARDRFYRVKPLPMPVKSSLDWFLLNKQLYWSAPHMIKVAKNIFENMPTINFKELSGKENNLSHNQKLEFLVKELELRKCEVIYIDMTIPEVEELGLKVVKVIVPEMVPLWRDERYPYLKISRLYDVPEKLGYKTKPIMLGEAFSVHPF
jgi:ribosomal protein S12 methylthiotransferase accessory factor